MSLGYQGSIPRMPITTVVMAYIVIAIGGQHRSTPVHTDARPSVRGYTSVPPIYGAERLPQIPLTTVAWVTAPSYGAGTSTNTVGMPMAYASANSHASQRDRNTNIAYLGAYQIPRPSTSKGRDRAIPSTQASTSRDRRPSKQDSLSPPSKVGIRNKTTSRIPGLMTTCKTSTHRAITLMTTP